MAKCCHNLVEWFACNSTSSHSMGTAKALQTSLLMPNLRCFFLFFYWVDLWPGSDVRIWNIWCWTLGRKHSYRISHSLLFNYSRQAGKRMFKMMCFLRNAAQCGQEQWEWNWMEKLQQKQQHPSFFFPVVGSAQLVGLSATIRKVL